jgi:hypothetical protein
MKMAVFWVVAPCGLVEVYRSFRDVCCLHHQGDEALRPDNGDTKHLCNNPDDRQLDVASCDCRILTVCVHTYVRNLG